MKISIKEATEKLSGVPSPFVELFRLHLFKWQVPKQTLQGFKPLEEEYFNSTDYPCG